MRKILIVAALLAANISKGQDAQPDITASYPKHELGLSGETNFGNTDYGGPGMLQYKYWARPNMAARVNAGVASYQRLEREEYFGRIGDTILERHTQDQATMAYGGFGLEMHRHFYKAVHLYAAVEAMVGYGHGSSEAQIIKRPIGMRQDYYPPGRPTMPVSEPLSIFNVNISPYIGAKFVFKRISFGTELSAVSMGYTYISSGTNSASGTVDMNAGMFRQRVFVLFRF